MAIRTLSAACLLLPQRVVAESGRVDPDLDLVKLDSCGGADCDAVSLLQLRGEPVHQASIDTEQESADSQQSEDSEPQLKASAASAGWGWNTWTVVAHSSQSGWAWDVVRVVFLNSAHEEVSPSSPGCHVVESGHVDVPGYSAQNAFSDDASWWGGRSDASSGKFYIGIGCSGDRHIGAVLLHQKDGHSASYVEVYHNQELVTGSGLSTGGLQHLWEGSFGLRLEAKNLHSGWAWDVRRLKVLLPSGELRPDGSHPYYCHAVESGHAGWGYEVSNAFDDSGSWWGGRGDAANDYYVGLECEKPFEWPDHTFVYLDQVRAECTEAAWPDKDHDLVCGECKVLVNHFSSYYKTCDGYCSHIGRQCVGAWEEVGDTCEVMYSMTCYQTVDSSDAICQCGDKKAGYQPSGHHTEAVEVQTKNAWGWRTKHTVYPGQERGEVPVC